MYVLVDIDHTLSNAFWRDPMIGNVSWDEYHTASKDDSPFYKIADLIKILIKNGDLIVCVTGRNESFRGLTIDWLIKYDILVHDLLMRPDNDFRKNGEIKKILVSNYFRNYYDNIRFLIDDNEEACLEFLSMGITTLQVRNYVSPSL